MDTRKIIDALLLVLLAASMWWIIYSQPYIGFKNVEMFTGEGEYPVQIEAVNYHDTAIGLNAFPSDPGTYPGIIMIHEWWGLNDNIQQMAAALAGHGYNVLAVDLYDGVVATSPSEAKTLVSSLDQDEAIINLQAAAEYLRDESVTKIASLGWCFGGGQSMQLAVSDVHLDATVIYYGNLVDDVERLKSVEWPVLGIFGDQDTSVPLDSVKRFESALDDVGVDHEIHVYKGVGHAFANPSGQNYAEDETKDAWQRTLDFLERNLQ